MKKLVAAGVFVVVLVELVALVLLDRELVPGGVGAHRGAGAACLAPAVGP